MRSTDFSKGFVPLLLLHANKRYSNFAVVADERCRIAAIVSQRIPFIGLVNFEALMTFPISAFSLSVRRRPSLTDAVAVS